MLIDLPVTTEHFSEGTTSLLDFYEKLGWNKERQSIDPRKIIMNADEAEESMKIFMTSEELPDLQAQLGLLWMNNGPAFSVEIPKGKVKLDDGWVIND